MPNVRQLTKNIMKTHAINRILILMILMIGWVTIHAQHQMEVPGDNFSLEGALELFKKSSSPQKFEQMLNDANSKVNNLDLNGDGYIDYIRVIDMNEGNIHTFILQAVISQNQNQDIAVITLEKLANGKAVLQIIGDEDIYGVETIIEPTREVYTNAGASSARYTVNVWAWPSVRYIYGPHYSVWISPWGWHYRPHWWRSWRPVAYYDYYPYWRPYILHYSVCHTHRVVYAHHYYRPHRTTSVIVHNRHYDRITHYRSTRIDNRGRYTASRDLSNDRRINTSARYDENGRIRSSKDRPMSSGSSVNTRNQQRSIEGNQSTSRSGNTYSPRSRSSADLRVGSSNTQDRSTSIRRGTSSERSSNTINRSPVTPNRESSSNKTGRNITSGSSNTQRIESGTSSNPGSKRSYSRSSESNQRKSTSTKVQGYSNRSSESSSIRKSSGNSTARRSSGSIGIKRSSGSSQANSNIKRSTGSTNVKKSSGSTGMRRPSGNSSIKRSSGSVKIQRSSGNSSVQRSSKKPTSSASSSRSSNSSSKSRGRQ